VHSFLAAFLLLVAPPVFSQPVGNIPPKHEVRAAWITTAASLDWPRTTNPAEQQASLRAVVRDLKAAHFNTIFFQARARGDAYYGSGVEPWAENLTGTLGKHPGWDPLQFLIDAGHALGLEVHAWFNVYKVRGPNPVARSSPLHPTLAHPGWVVQYEGESWLDPGIPEVNPYLLRVALELVQRYDIDGIHFDFIRYPGRDFNDRETYRKHGNGMGREDWRRSNVDRFVNDFYDRAMALKPMLKVGSAPFGIYDGIEHGDAAGSYYSVYQDSRGWLAKGKHDYLVPQIYWTIASSPGNPPFSELAKGWARNSSGRHVYAGIAAYKADVKREIPAQIDSSRSAGLHGQAFFRYEHVKSFDMLGDRYAHPAHIPAMPWKDSVPPQAPGHLAATEISPDIFQLEWTPPGADESLNVPWRYTVYRSTSSPVNTDDPSLIGAIVPASVTSFRDTIRRDMGIRYFYAVTASDRQNNESPPAIAEAVILEVVELKERLYPRPSLTFNGNNSTAAGSLVGYRLPRRISVSLDIYKVEAGDSIRHVANLEQGVRDRGTYVVGLAGEFLRAPGRYMLRLKAGEDVLEHRVEAGSP
jgi:uncharacterized lipoprotein YddW (UPF0748 family)